MSTPLLVKLRTAAQASPLASLLGSPLRFYDTRLFEGSAYPAVVQQVISYPKYQAMDGRNPTGKARVQFTVWEGYTRDTTGAVPDALKAMIDLFNGTASAASSQVINEFPTIDPDVSGNPIYKTVVEAYCWNDETT